MIGTKADRLPPYGFSIMMIALDSYYTIGKLHWFCEDYVGQGWQPFPYVILADGCSAALDSDLGARLLVLSARCLLTRFALKAYDQAERAARHWSLGRRIIRRAARQVRDLGVDTAVLDATLLIAWCDGESVHVHLYGDGCIATRQADGTVGAIQIEYAGNAPFYLSYLLDVARSIEKRLGSRWQRRAFIRSARQARPFARYRSIHPSYIAFAWRHSLRWQWQPMACTP